MKVAVVGNGNVGIAVLDELRSLGGVDEIVLIGRSQERIRAEIMDYLDARALYHEMTAGLSCGSYEAVRGADIIVYTAGAKRAEGESRLDLLRRNVSIAREVFQEIGRYNQEAIVITVANPVDIINYEISKLRPEHPERVIGTGTLLDTARLKHYLSELCDISVHSISGYVIGEHGDSSVITWSNLRIGGLTVNEFNEQIYGQEINLQEEVMKRVVQGQGARIIKGKGYTAYGVALAVRRIISAIIHNEREILPVSTTLLDQYTESACAISVPCILGEGGIVRPVRLKLTEEEEERFHMSVQTVSEACKQAENGED